MQPAAVAKPNLSKQRLRFWLQLLRATRFVETDVRERLRTTFESTLPRFDVLAALDRAEHGLKMSELSRMLRVSNGNVTGIVDRLVADGLVVRVPVESDRRAMLVRLTRRGQEAFAEMAATHELWVDEILGDLNADEMAAAAATLEKLKEDRP